MLPRLIALAFAMVLVPCALLRAQQALPPEGSQVLKSSQSAAAMPESAWIDLRQNEAAHSKVQAAPAWVESVNFSPSDTHAQSSGKSVFRLRLARPNEDCQLLLLRLYFDDLPNEKP